jgi:hypothetical protein
MAQVNALDFGPGGSQRFARNSGRSISGEALGAIRYPSPFFDIAHTYLPSSFKSMLRWCRYYFLTNPIINAVCYKMAEYPVTDLIFDTDNEHLREKWSYLFDSVLQFKRFEIETGLDYNAYGNAFISIYFPFNKLLICKGCNHSARVEQQKYVFRDFKFVGTCRRCNHYGEFRVRDHYIRSIRDIRLIRWNPEYITIQHNEATGENRYYYTIPGALSNDIRVGKRHIIEKVPQIFIEALRKNKALLFSKDNIYHMKRPTIAQKDKGWGMPMILPVLKQTFYLQILQKAQEAIAIEHIVPMRVLFPQSASGTADVYSTVNLSQWREKIEQELVRWRLDNNYIPILPIPVGQETLGGDGRALMLAQEYRVWTEQIVAGMGVPIEFVYGGMQYSGSNVSMRILENHFLSQKSQRKQLIKDFILPSIGAFMGWPVTPCHYRKFKMADDLQRSAFYLQLNQAGKISDKSLLEDTDWDSFGEAERITLEQSRTLENQRKQALSQAAIQGEAGVVMAKYQGRSMKVQQNMMSLADQGMGQPMPPDPNAAAGAAGQPPMASPNAVGQDMNAQQGAANASGAQLPQQAMQNEQAMAQQPPPGGAPPPPGMDGTQSQLGADQAMTEGPAMDIMSIAQQTTGWLNQLPDHEKQHELGNMKRNNPQLYHVVLQMLQMSAGAQQSSAAMPQPEQRPARRGPEAQSV